MPRMGSKPELLELNTLDVFIAALRVKQCLNENATYVINRQPTLDEKRLAVLEWLKVGDDSVLEVIEEICKKNNWADAVKIIRQESKVNNDGAVSNIQSPFVFGVKKPVDHFTGRENIIHEMHDIIISYIANYATKQHPSYNERKYVNQLVITGLGGIGKTQLVLKYIQKYKSAFDSIVWINAESEMALKTSIFTLASFLEIKAENVSFGILVTKVFQKLSENGNKNLVVFDNADDIDINELVPIEFNCHFFLITSRHQCWINSTIIKLEALTLEEAITFINMSLKRVVNTETDDIKTFVLTLECFPLALKQAASFIKMKNLLNTQTYSFKDYLYEFEANVDNAKQLLRFLPKDTISNGRIATLNTFTTWRITLDKIKCLQYEVTTQISHEINLNSNGAESLPSRILNISAYLTSDNIPVKLFYDMATQDEEHLLWAIDSLEKYSLASVSQGMMKIHKLVQQVTRLNLLYENRNKAFIEAAIKLVVKKFPFEDERSEAVSLKRTLLPHLIELKKYVTCFEKHQFSNEFFDLVCSLFYCINDVCYNLFAASIGKNISQELLAIQVEHYGSEHPETARTLVYLANSYGNLGDPQMKKTLLERVLKIQEQHYGHSHFQVAITLGYLANAYCHLGNPQMQKTLLERALEIKERHFGCDHYEVAITLDSLANAYRHLGDPQTMKKLMERALQTKEHHFGSNHFQVAITLCNLAFAYGDLGDPLSMKMLMERALEIKERCYGSNHFQVAITLENLAKAHGDLGNTLLMKMMLERALQIKEGHYGSDHYQVAITLTFLASAYCDFGDPHAAKSLLDRALKIKEHHYGSDHFNVAITLDYLANCYYYLGDPEEMKTLMEKALNIKIRYYGEDHFQLAVTLRNLAIAYGSLGNLQRMKSLLKKCLQIQERHYGPDNFQVAITLDNLSSVYCNLGNFQAMKKLMERALQIKEDHYGLDHFQVAITLRNLATAYGELGDLRTQKTLLYKVLQIQECHYGKNNFQVAITRWSLGHCNMRLNEVQEAKKLFENILPIFKQHYGQNHKYVNLARFQLDETCKALEDSQTSLSCLQHFATEKCVML